MLTFANLPSFLWVEAIATACFTQNRSIIYKRFDKTPYELINKRKPNIKFFRVFGCRCYLLNDYEDVGKPKAKGDIGVFVGYSKESAAFRIYNKRTRKIHESVNVNFDEILEMASKQFSLEPSLSNLNETGKSLNLSVSNKRTRKIHESVNVNFDEISEMASKQFILEPSLSNLNETGKSLNLSVSQFDEASKKDLEDLFQDFYNEYFDSSKIMKSSTTNVETSIIEEVFQESIPINMIPNDDEASTSHNVFNDLLEYTYFDATEALMDADWVSAMQEELDQFARLKVWRLLLRHEGKSVIKTKWIFKNKKDEIIARIKDIRLFLAYAAHKDFKVFQMDIKTAFLNEILKEEVYIGQPPGFVSKQYPDHVYAFDKALYGLK
nr:hypothetical protein [Tanacetum cinerariifolium]